MRRRHAVLRDPLLWLTAGFVALVVAMPYAAPIGRLLAPAGAAPVYGRDSFLALSVSHLALVAASTAIALGLGVGLAILVTRPFARELRGLAEALVALGQCVPPVAVLALAVPLLGFGAVPTILALTLYGLLPILQTTLAAFDGLPEDVTEAARGTGLTSWQILTRIEMPLAGPVILSGLRTSTVIAMGTATVGSLVGAKSLGDPIIAGLVNGNPAYVVEGCIVVAFMATLVDALLSRAQGWVGRPQ